MRAVARGTIARESELGFADITLGSAIAGAVPEPSTWAVMIIGFFALCSPDPSLKLEGHNRSAHEIDKWTGS
jgi:hypothetical protein